VLNDEPPKLLQGGSCWPADNETPTHAVDASRHSEIVSITADGCSPLVSLYNRLTDLRDQNQGTERGGGGNTYQNVLEPTEKRGALASFSLIEVSFRRKRVFPWFGFFPGSGWRVLENGSYS
jgi:hypothetical protein